jgi:probable F420-dependent oxidoreductase
MKIRIGAGSGPGIGPGEFAGAVDSLEAHGIDSLWLPEVVYSSQIDPMIGIAHALARTTRLKVGSGVAILPGRQPVLVAKQLASLAGLAPGRVLPVFGLHSARPQERALFPVPSGQRAAVFDESLALVRQLLEQPEVTFHGQFFQVEGASLGTLPAKPLDLWLGGSAPAALQRVGRLADGWLASFVTPGEARRGRIAIEHAADEAGREVEPDHFGVSLAVCDGDLPADLVAAARARRPDADPTELIPTGWAQARQLVERYIDAGMTKFVIRPAGTPFPTFLDRLLTELVPLQN